MIKLLLLLGLVVTPIIAIKRKYAYKMLIMDWGGNQSM
jgi:hypothetical protein